MVEETTVGTADSSVAGGHSSVVVGTSDLNSLHLVSAGVFLQVSDSKFASGSTLGSELVSLGSVRSLSLVCDSSFEHCSSIY